MGMTKTQIKALEVVTTAGEIEEGAARIAGANLSALYRLAKIGALVARKGTFQPMSGPYAGQDLPTTFYRVA